LIFVTVGTQRFQFNRLFEELDVLIENGVLKERVIAQIGFTDYVPSNFTAEKMISPEKVNNLIKESSLIITHAGTSSIISSLKKEKKVIVVPRQKKFGEHVDDHQMEITKLFEIKEAIESVYEIKELGEKIQIIKNKTYKRFGFDNRQLLNSIDEYLEGLKK
jgi:UDP-N-acetylglucosamine transferase subunit ALG13